MWKYLVSFPGSFGNHFFLQRGRGCEGRHQFLEPTNLKTGLPKRGHETRFPTDTEKIVGQYLLVLTNV